MPKKKTKDLKNIPKARAYIYATYNNTIVTFTDHQGQVIASASAGGVGFSGPKKATPHASGVVIRSVYEKVKDMGIKELKLFVKGVGTGRDAAIRALIGLGFNITVIKDITPIPHNGCRPRKIRRV
ncbi:MAG: 30S ribosomal protein S11 [Ignavibacterium sp.]|nr:30S ribosomal protein S11 [Ignavibacterium sp.]